MSKKKPQENPPPRPLESLQEWTETPRDSWSSVSARTFSDIPVDKEKEAAVRKRQKESAAALDAAIAPFVKEYEDAPEVEPEDDRDLEETIHDLFADRQTLDRKARAQRLSRMASRGRDEFGRPLPQRSDLLYEHGIGVSPEELARFEATLDDED